MAYRERNQQDIWKGSAMKHSKHPLPLWASIMLIGTMSAAIWGIVIAITIIAWETFKRGL